jgi:hypothetical protein
VLPGQRTTQAGWRDAARDEKKIGIGYLAPDAPQYVFPISSGISAGLAPAIATCAWCGYVQRAEVLTESPAGVLDL